MCERPKHHGVTETLLADVNLSPVEALANKSLTMRKTVALENRRSDSE
jgi:hypothetical protein